MYRLCLIILVSVFLSASVQGQADVTESPSAIPVRYGIVVDNSGTFRFALERAVRLLSSVVRQQNEGDKGFLLTYTDAEGIFLRVEPTSDVDELADSIENVYVIAGRSAVWDALYAAADQFDKPEEGITPKERRMIILVTDGDEKGSSIKPDVSLKRLKERGVTVHVVGMGERRVQEKTVERIASQTGGKKFIAATADDLQTIAAELIGILKGKE